MADVRHGHQEPTASSASRRVARERCCNVACTEIRRAHNRSRPAISRPSEEGRSAEALSLRLHSRRPQVPGDHHLSENEGERTGGAQRPKGRLKTCSLIHGPALSIPWL